MPVSRQPLRIKPPKPGGKRQKRQEEKAHGTAMTPNASSQVVADAELAAQLQQEEQHEAGDSALPSGKDSLLLTASPRSDNEMKALLQTLSPPHFTHASKTHGQNACLIDSILLALQDKQLILPLALDDRAAICKSIRLHLIDHHGLAPPTPDGFHSFFISRRSL